MNELKNQLFPKRSSGILEEIIYSSHDSTDYLHHYWLKNTSKEAIIIANQYFGIEELMKESFLYVSPIKSNELTSSSRFATIIRESCNLYEILCKKVYFQLFDISKSTKLNIYKYLSLEHFFKINDQDLRSPVFHNYLETGASIRPFKSLENWDQESKINSDMIPKWWNAYNKIKHSAESYAEHATLNNAIYSLSALFLIIRKIYGDGLISGFLRKPTEGSEIHIYPIRNSDIFIGEIMKYRKTFN